MTVLAHHLHLPYAYVRHHYNVPACRGRRVRVYDREGIIAECHGHYIGVNFDDCKPGVIQSAHPTDGVEYLDMGTIRKMTRSQRRYQEYLDSDTDLTFAEFIGVRR